MGWKKFFGIVMALIIAIVLYMILGDKKQIYTSDTHVYENMVWARPDKTTLTIDVTPNMLNKPMSLYLDVSHTMQVRKNMMQIDMEILTPKGEERLSTYKVWFKNHEGKFKGTPHENLYDLHHLLRTNFEFNQKGIWTFVIQQRSEFQFLEGIQSIKLVAEELPKKAK